MRQQRQPAATRPTFRDDQITASFGMVRNPNKSLAWSSISSNHPNQQHDPISALDYKVSNPSSSLVMSSLSNIYQHYQQQKDIQTKQSDEYEFNTGRNGASFGQNQYKRRRRQQGESKNSQKSNNTNVSNEFYRYLMANNQHTSHNRNTNNNNTKQPIQLRQSNQPPLQYHPSHTSITSMQQSLLHLQHSQQQLSYLKQKLQQAYEKLQKQILHSYDLEERIEVLEEELSRWREEVGDNKMQIEQLRGELEERGNLLMLERRENEKLRFTLKTIIKNQSLREQLSMCESQSNLHNNSTSAALSCQSVNDSLLRQNQLKQNLRMKLQLKDQHNTITKLNQTISQLKTQNTRHSSQLKSKDKYLSQLMQQFQSLQQQLQHTRHQLQEMTTTKKTVSNNNDNKDQQKKYQKQIEVLMNEKKVMVLRQGQLMNKIAILQQQLRMVTDEKVTVMSRLKHEIALLQGQIQQLLQENQAIKAINQQHFILKQQQFIIDNQNTVKNADSLQYIAYSPNTIGKNHNNNNTLSSVNKQSKVVDGDYNQAPLIFDSEEEDVHNTNSINNRGRNQSQTKIPPPSKRQRNFNASDYQNKTYKSSRVAANHQPHQSNKQNLMNNNNNNTMAQQHQQPQSYSQNQLSKLQKSVGKWKRSHSQLPSNNSSIYYEGNSNNSQSQNIQQQQHQQQQSLYQEVGQRQLEMSMPPGQCPTQKPHHSKLSLQPPQSQDQKLSKYQQHRKNIQTQLQSLQNIKRPTKQQRERIEKLQKQLYYLDSDIAGLKRKIRRKY